MVNTTRLRSLVLVTAMLCLSTGFVTSGFARPRGDLAWIEITPSTGGPSARAGHTLTAVGGQIYLFGGTPTPGTDDLWRFDSSTGAFAQVHATNPPPARSSHAAASVDGKLFVFGGLSPSGGGFLDDVWSFDPPANAWTKVTIVGESPAPRAFHQAVSDGQKIYFGGGFGTSSEGAFIDRWVFDPASSTWTRLFPAAATDGKDVQILPIGDCGRYGVIAIFFAICSIFAPLDECNTAAIAMFGGESLGDSSKAVDVHSDILEMHRETGALQRLETSGAAPPGLALAATATFAPAGTSGTEAAGKVLIAGGELGGGLRSNRTYIAQGDPDRPAINFSQGPDLPLELSESAAAYVADFPFAGGAPGPAVVLFGGRTSGSAVTARTFVLRAETAPESADLSGEWTTAPTQKCKNNKCRISGTLVVRNGGTIGSSAATLSIFLSDDSDLDDSDTLIRTSEIPAMAAGGSTTFDLKKKQRIKLPNGVSAAGRFIITVVDFGGVVDEGNEGNNRVVAGPLQ